MLSIFFSCKQDSKRATNADNKVFKKELIELQRVLDAEKVQGAILIFDVQKKMKQLFLNGMVETELFLYGNRI